MVRLDHLLFAAPRLTDATDALRRQGGLDMQPGGRHVGYGTHNALAHLGDERYLEAIALDATQAGGSFADAVRQVQAPSLFAWCARCDDPPALRATLAAMGHATEEATMSRVTPDGGTLSWTLILAHDHGFGGAAPFFIHWGATPHPTTRLPPRARLQSFKVRHPRALDLQAWWHALGGAVLENGPRFDVADRAGLHATVEGDDGAWTMDGAPVHIASIRRLE